MKHFIPLSLAFLFFALTAGVYVVMYGVIATGVSRTSAALEKTHTLSERDALVRSQQALLENTAEERAVLEAYVAGSDDVVEAIELVEDTAQRARVSLAVSTVTTVEHPGWEYHEELEIHFSASGSFREMMNFIAALEAVPHSSLITSASLEASREDEWFGAFTMMFVKEK